MHTQFSSKFPKLSFIRWFNEFMKNFHHFFFKNFSYRGNPPPPKLFFFFANFSFSKCIFSGIFKDFFLKILKGSVREQLTLTKFLSEIMKTRFSVPPGSIRTSKHAACFDVLTPGVRRNRIFRNFVELPYKT